MCNLCIRISCFIGVIDDGPPSLVASEDLPDDVATYYNGPPPLVASEDFPDDIGTF